MVWSHAALVGAFIASCNLDLAFGSLVLGSLSSTLAILCTQASTAAHYIARVPQFIENVLLKNYRLWRGIQDALISSA
jgi:hypothetical protein